MSFSVMPPTARCTNASSTSSRSSLRRLSVTASSEPCTSAFRTRLSVATLAGLDLAEDVLELDARLARGRRRAGPSGAERCSRASPTVRAVFSSAAARNSSPASGTRRQAEHLDRHRRAGLLDLLALVVDHRPHAAPRRAGDDRVADLQRALVDEHRGHRAAAGVEVGLEHDALGPTGRVGRELLELGDDQQLVEQVVDAEVLRAPTSRRRSCRRPTTRARAPARRAGSARAAGRRCPCRSC